MAGTVTSDFYDAFGEKVSSVLSAKVGEQYTATFMNKSDGIDERNVKKIDKTAFGAKRIGIQRVEYAVKNMDVIMSFGKRDPGNEMKFPNGTGIVDFVEDMGWAPWAGTGFGDITFTTEGAKPGSEYSIKLNYCIKG